MHVEALLEDQVSVALWPTAMLAGESVTVTVGAGVPGLSPPPQALNDKIPITPAAAMLRFIFFMPFVPGAQSATEFVFGFHLAIQWNVGMEPRIRFNMGARTRLLSSAGILSPGERAVGS